MPVVGANHAERYLNQRRALAATIDNANEQAEVLGTTISNVQNLHLRALKLESDFNQVSENLADLRRTSLGFTSMPFLARFRWLFTGRGPTPMEPCL